MHIVCPDLIAIEIGAPTVDGRYADPESPSRPTDPNLSICVTNAEAVARMRKKVVYAQASDTVRGVLVYGFTSLPPASGV